MALAPLLWQPKVLRHDQVPNVYGFAVLPEQIVYKCSDINAAKTYLVEPGSADVDTGSKSTFGYQYVTSFIDVVSETAYREAWVRNYYFWFSGTLSTITLDEPSYIVMFQRGGRVGERTNFSFRTSPHNVTDYSSRAVVYPITTGYSAAYDWNNPPPRGAAFFTLFDWTLATMIADPSILNFEPSFGAARYLEGRRMWVMGPVTQLGGLEISMRLEFTKNYTGGSGEFTWCHTARTQGSQDVWTPPTPKPSPPNKNCDIGSWNLAQPFTWNLYFLATQNAPFFDMLDVPVGD